MIEAGAVGAVFRIIDEASPVLIRIMEQMDRLQAAVDRTKASLDTMKMPPGLTASMGRLERRMAAIADSSKIAGGEISKSFGGMDASINAATASMGRLNAEMRAATVEAQAMARGGVGAAASGLESRAASAAAASSESRVAGAAAVAGGSISAIEGQEAYALRRANVRQRGTGAAVARNAAHGGGGVGFNARVPGPAHTHAHIGLGNPIVLGGFAAAVGEWEAVQKSMDLAKIQESLVINGVSRDQVTKATALSYALGEKFGQPVQSILETINEIRNPLGGLEAAMEHVKHLGDAMVVLRSEGIKAGKPLADELYNVVKSGELRNAIHDEDFDKAVDAIVRVDVATAGRVDPQQTLQQWKMMKGALPGLNDDFLYRYAPELAQEFQGAPSGTYLSSLYQQIVSGQMRTTGLRLLDALGEIDRTKAEFDKNGRIVRTKPGANKLGDIFKDDPMKYMDRLIDDMFAHGITREGDQRDEIAQIFGNRNAAWIAQVLKYQRQRLDRGAAGIGGTLPIDKAAQELLNNDPTTKMNTMMAAINNMLTAVGGATMGPVTKFFQDVADVANFARDPHTSSQWNALTGWKPEGPFHIDRVAQLGDSALWQWRERNQAQSSLYRAGYTGGNARPEMEREALRGHALGNMPPPPPVVNVTDNTKVNVTVTLDGRAIAAAVSTQIMKDNRVVNSANGFDGRASWTPPDTAR